MIEKKKMIDELIIKEIERSDQYRIIKQFTPVDKYNDPDDEEIKIGIYLDIETTGLIARQDRIIELAMVPFEFQPNGKIYQVLPAYNEFQDPGEPIPRNITKITGITDEMVSGRSIDLESITSMISKSVIIIAHNAKFDRPFAELLHNDFKNISWGCSMADVDWAEEGIESTKLEYIAYRYGFFYKGHRATIDCYAGIHVLTQNMFESNEPVLKRLLDTARKTQIRLFAQDSPYDKKDVLKARGYSWSDGKDGSVRSWFQDVLEEDLEQEIKFLESEIYGR